MVSPVRPRRGEIWSVRFDPSIGAEIRKLRPAIVVSVGAVGKLPLRIVVPLTDWQPSFASLPWFTKINATNSTGLTKDSGADAFQVKSISEQRFIRKIGEVSEDQMDQIAAAIALCVGA